RIAWALERGLIWPLEEKAGGWSPSLRLAGAMSLALLAAGAGVLGLVLASGDGSGNSGAGTVAGETSAPAPAAAAAPAAKVAPTAAAPVLHGAKPDFATEVGGGVAKGSAAEAPAAGGPGSSPSTAG